MTGLRLPPRRLVSKPDPDDPTDYYSRPLTAPLYRARLRDALALLGPGPFDALLDVGYGSGVFLPELARRTRRLVGVDVHAGRAGVEAMVRALGLEVELREASLFELPFADGEFAALATDVEPTRWADAAVDAHALPYEDASVANLVLFDVFHHLRDPARFLDEARRTLRPGGRVVLVEPYCSAVSAVLYRRFHHERTDLHVDPFAAD